MFRTVLRRSCSVAVAFCCLTWFLPAAHAQSVVVLPYIQPGDGRTLAGTDVKVVRWLTDQKPGDFTVEYQVADGPIRTVTPSRISLDFPAIKPKKKEDGNDKKETDDDDDIEDKKDAKDDKGKKETVPPIPEKDQQYIRYTAHLTDLPFNTEVRYCVKLLGKPVREASFKTRVTADKTVRCILVGDLAQGRKAQREVAYQIYKQKPEFLVALGDIVYPNGRVSQYMGYYWGTYNNVADTGPLTGAPLMATTTFYPVLGNHDVAAKLSNTPDALGAYYFFSPPRNGPGAGPWITPLDGKDAANAKFLAATQDSYPHLDAYSFDYGSAHFVVLNNNPAMKIESPEFLHWLRSDLKSAKAKWKFVCFHIPGFQSARQHYTEQQTRPLNPIFEECGVDITFASHVHNYQRSVPLKFVPDVKREKKGKVDGVFTLDHLFDGVKNTIPSGVMHIVAGGGGASLYGPSLEKTAPDLKKLHGANYADFTAKMVVDKHSFVMLDIAPDRLRLQAISASGDVLDEIAVTKKK